MEENILWYFFVLMVVALFLFGSIFLIRVWRGIKDEEVIAMTDLEEIRQWNGSSQHPEGSYSAKVVVEHFALGAVQEVSVSPAPLTMEPKAQKIANLEQQLRTLETQAAVTAAKDQETTTQLTQDNNKLKRQIEEKQVALERLTVEIETVRQSYERLCRDEQENIAKIDQCGKEFAQLRQEAITQQAQLTAQLTQGQDENRQLRDHGEQRQKQIERLRASLEVANQVHHEKEILDQQLVRAMARLRELQREREELIRTRASLQEDLAKVKDFNIFLLEKEKILQYELTKQRVQALGLEKICEDFRIQLDEMSRSGATKR